LFSPSSRVVVEQRQHEHLSITCRYELHA
jgi:hypothetical protein